MLMSPAGLGNKNYMLARISGNLYDPNLSVNSIKVSVAFLNDRAMIELT
jgi:hypothetical protein